MPWGADRPDRVPMPAGWARTRRRVLRESDGCCVCGRDGADEVDHRVSRARGGGEGSNLAPIHRGCHARKSALEGVARRRELAGLRFRRADRHPGSFGV